MSAAGGSNPEYVSARVRSRRAKLFDEDQYRDLVRMGPSEIARFMEETEYDEEINRMGSRYSGVDLIEYALNRNLARHFADVLRFAEGGLYDLIARYLRKFDVWNVKTVIRGLYSDATPEEIRSDLILAGELDAGDVDELIDAGDVEGVVEALEGTVFEAGLESALADFEATNSLVPIENAVDRAFYENLLSGLGGESGEVDAATELYVEFLQAEVDFLNIRNALRTVGTGADLDPGDYYIDGGRLFSAAELTQIGSNADELVGRVRESRYGDELDEALAGLAEAESLVEFENATERALLTYADRLSSRYPLSVCPVLAYVIAKEREVNNIRAVARGKEAGLDPEEIQEELVL